MSLLLALLYVAPPEPEAKKAHGIEKQPTKPKRGRYEVDSFSDFVRKPITRNDDDELMLIYMMQGATIC
jgi:hypothetical protein